MMSGYMTKREILKALEDFDMEDVPQAYYDFTGDGLSGFFFEGYSRGLCGFVIVDEMDAERENDPESIRGKGRQPWETPDEYYDRVDREVREAGEKRYPLGFTVFLLLLVAAIFGCIAWAIAT